MPVRVREGDYRHALAWDSAIQRPFIANTSRIDAKWQWHWLYLRSVMLEIASGRRLAYLQMVTPNPGGLAVVIGQLLIADGFPYPPDPREQCAFVWYLTTTPEDACRHFNVARSRGLMNALLDSAIQFSYLRGYDGRICLHASPDGSPQQQVALATKYQEAGLMEVQVPKIGRVRRNDGRYFYANPDTARVLSFKSDLYR